jgi:hypothetical protein
MGSMRGRQNSTCGIGGVGNELRYPRGVPRISGPASMTGGFHLCTLRCGGKRGRCEICFGRFAVELDPMTSSVEYGFLLR